MSREFDDELNGADRGRENGADRNGYGKAGSASVGNRRTSGEPDSYEEDYYLDEDFEEGERAVKTAGGTGMAAGYAPEGRLRADANGGSGRRTDVSGDTSRRAGASGAGVRRGSGTAGDSARRGGAAGEGVRGGGVAGDSARRGSAAGEGVRGGGVAGDSARRGSAAGEGVRGGGVAGDSVRRGGTAGEGVRGGGVAGENARRGGAAGEGVRGGGVAGDSARRGSAAGDGVRGGGAAGENTRRGSAAGEGVRGGGVAGDSVRRGGAAGEGVRSNGAAGESVRRGGAAGDGVRRAGTPGDTARRADAAGDTTRRVSAAGDSIRRADTAENGMNRTAGRSRAEESVGGSRQTGEPVRRSAGEAERRSGTRIPGSETGSAAGARTSRGSQTAGGTRDTYGSQTRAAASRSAAQAAKKKKVKRIVITAILEVFTLIAIFAYGYLLRVDSSIRRPGNFDPANVSNPNLSVEMKQHMTGYKTIAVFGVDSRDGNVSKGTNADVIMLCNINRDTGEIRLVSVFRDSYLNVSEKGSYNKINSAYANGGAEQSLAAINRNLDLDIEDYVTFNWKAVADGINMLGGVEDVDISKAEFRYINSFITETVQKTGVPSFQLKSAGVQHLDGVQAVAYGRLRLMDTDYARTERQRIIIQKAFEKAKKADLGLLNRILLMEVEQVETSLSFSDFTDLILDIGKYYIGETGGFPFSRDSMIMGGKGDCVIPTTLESNVTELHKFLYGKEDYDPSPTVKKISAKIAADSGKYKQGANAGHVATDKGYIPEETTKETKKENVETEEDKTTAGGDTIFETDENGETIEATRPDESSPDGTKPVKPGETTADGTKPTKPGETADGTDPTKPTKPGETTEDGTRPTKPGESTADGTGPTKPGETSEGSKGPGESEADGPKPSSPEESKQERPSESVTGPGEGPGTRPSESTQASEPTSAVSDGPGGPGGGDSHGGGPHPGDGGDDIVTVGPPGSN